MTKTTYGIIPATKNILFCLTIIFLMIIHARTTSASEWYDNGTLHEASIKQWKSATYSNKLATSAGFIIDARNDGYFLHDGKINSDNPLKRLSEILVENTDEYVKITINQDEPISKIVLQVMLELGWIKPDYLIFLAESAHNVNSSRIKGIMPTPKLKLNKANSNGGNIPVNNSSSRKVKIRKYRLMSPVKGRKWVKKNITPATAFSEDEFVERFGNYEKAIESLTNKKTLEKYYFKRINMTFFVLQEHQTLIGFCEGKGFLKSQS